MPNRPYRAHRPATVAPDVAAHYVPAVTRLAVALTIAERDACGCQGWRDSKTLFGVGACVHETPQPAPSKAERREVAQARMAVKA